MYSCLQMKQARYSKPPALCIKKALCLLAMHYALHSAHLTASSTEAIVLCTAQHMAHRSTPVLRMQRISWLLCTTQIRGVHCIDDITPQACAAGMWLCRV